MKKLTLLALVALMAATTLFIFDSQSLTVNMLDNQASFWGTVKEADGSCAPINGTTSVYLIGQGVYLHTTTQNCGGDLPCCYSFGGQQFSTGEYTLLATDVHGHARIVKLRYYGTPIRTDITLSAESIN